MNETSHYCELCAPAGWPLFPHNVGKTTREPGKCYCGKPLAATPPDGPAGSPKPLFVWHEEAGCLNMYGNQSQRVDELAARISRIESENREWRAAAARISLTPLPDNFTPAQWLSLQVNAITALLDKAKCS